MFSIFNIFKRDRVEPVFKVLGTDMHCHLLPGVDDGSKSDEMTMECLRVMHEVGYSRLYLTPHFQHPRYPNDEVDIRTRYAALREHVSQRDIGIELAGIGGEYRIDDYFERNLDDNRYLTVGSDRYLLLELSLSQQRLGFDKIIFDLQMKDHDIILAHPERYPYISINSPVFEKLKDQGVLFQCNILSLSGFYGGEARERALQLIQRGWVDLLGTDLHNCTYAHALRAATQSRTVRRVLESNTFMNKTL